VIARWRSIYLDVRTGIGTPIGY